jgi:hypothetical protein
MTKERSTIDFGQTNETASESIEEKYKAEMRQIVLGQAVGGG